VLRINQKVHLFYSFPFQHPICGHSCYKEQKKVCDKIENKAFYLKIGNQTAIIMQIKITIPLKHGCNFIYLFFTSNKHFNFLSLFYLIRKIKTNYWMQVAHLFLGRSSPQQLHYSFSWMGCGKNSEVTVCKTWEPLTWKICLEANTFIWNIIVLSLIQYQCRWTLQVLACFYSYGA